MKGGDKPTNLCELCELKKLEGRNVSWEEIIQYQILAQEGDAIIPFL
jgi:hypothetical protein